MQKINIHDAKTRLSAVLAEIERTDESFVICRNGEPVADLVPHRKQSRLKKHPVMSKIKIGYDPTEDLTTDEWGTID